MKDLFFEKHQLSADLISEKLCHFHTLLFAD